MWKSNNQGVKEEIFIQTYRRGGHRQPGWRGLSARWQLVDQVRWWDKIVASQESSLERPTEVLEHTQAHTPRNQHQKGPICLWVAGEMTESWVRTEQAAWFPF